MNKKITSGLFAYEGPLHIDANGEYCDLSMTNEMFNRYLNVVDMLYVLIPVKRLSETYKEAHMTRLDTCRIIVVELPNLYKIKNQFNKKRTIEIITKYVKNADLIFIRDYGQVPYLTSKVAVKEHKDYLCEVGGCSWDAFTNHGILGKVISPYMYYTERYSVGHASFVSYVTEFFLQKRYPSDSLYQINCSNAYISIDEDVLERRLKKTENEVITLGTAVHGIDVKYKGEDVVLKAMRILKDKGINTRYEVAGPGKGEYFRKVAGKLGITDQLIFTGNKNSDEMITWLENIDIYVQASKQEGLPRAVIEAMSKGCYCLASDIAGNPELLDKDFLSTANDYKTIASQIELYSKISHEKRNIVRRRNFERAMKYEKNVLNQRRMEFFESYKNSIMREP